MTQPNNTVTFDGPRRVELVRDDLLDAIRAGRLAPGHELSVAGIAEVNRVRAGTLRMLLARLVADELVSIRGDALIVAPLRMDQFRQPFHLARKIEDYLLTRVCATISPVELAAARALLDRVDPAQEMDSFNFSIHQVYTQLLRPAASAHDVRIINDLHETMRRYINLGAITLRDQQMGSDNVQHNAELGIIEVCRELIARIADGATEGALQLIDSTNRAMLAEVALESRSSETRPSVIDFAAARAARRGSASGQRDA
jgi:DNA-binding GntR family transcriptional regulator